MDVLISTSIGNDETAIATEPNLGHPDGVFGRIFRVTSLGGSRPRLYSAAALRLKLVGPKLGIPYFRRYQDKTAVSQFSGVHYLSKASSVGNDARNVYIHKFIR